MRCSLVALVTLVGLTDQATGQDPRLSKSLTLAATAVGTSITSIQLGWSPVTGATSYRVLRGANPAGPFVVAGTVAAPETGLADGGLVPGAVFHYRIEALAAAPPVLAALKSGAPPSVRRNLAPAPAAALVAPAVPPITIATLVTSGQTVAPAPFTITKQRCDNSTPRKYCRYLWPATPGAVTYRRYGEEGNNTCSPPIRDADLAVGSVYYPAVQQFEYPPRPGCDRHWIRAVYRMANFPTPGTVFETEGPAALWP